MNRVAPPTGATLNMVEVLAIVDRTVRRVGVLIRGVGADPEDVKQDVLVAILEAQLRPGSRYDATRGYAESTYIHQVARCATLNALRRPRRQRLREESVMDVEERVAVDAAEGSEEGAASRLFSELEAEERTMAQLLAGGSTLVDARRVMGLSEGAASELRTRVRALLLHLRDE